MDQPEKNENISLDDISFDDMLSGGVETTAEAEEPKVETEVADEELDADADNLKSEEEPKEVEEEVEEEEEEEEEQEEQEEEPVDEDGESTVVSEILSTLGYETDGEYEDTTEGLLQLTKDVGAQMAEDQLDQLFEAFPLVKKHLEYVLDGGDSQNFMQAYDPNLDYSKINIKDDDMQTQKAILSDYFATKGHDQAFIEELLEDYQDNGKLQTKAEAAKDALVKMQAAQREQLNAQQAEQRQETQRQQQEFWNGVYDTIEESQEFAGIAVPEREKSKFFDYISTPVTKEGYTQRDLDHNDADMEVRLAIDYLMYKGFNLSDIVDTKARTKSARSLRDKISRNEENLKSARKARRRKKSFDIDDLDLSI